MAKVFNLTDSVITFSGANDDLVEVEGGVEEEFSINDIRSDVGHTRFLVESPAGRVIVHAIYDGCWSFAYGMAEEADEIPDWGFSYVEFTSYSMGLTFAPGVGATLKQLTPDG